MRIEVTAEDIAAGERGKCLLCPIALAARRAGLETARVDLDTQHGESIADLIGVLLPDECLKFIIDFDNGKPVAPFVFELDVTA